MLNYVKLKNVTAALQIAAVTTILGLCSAMQAQAQEGVKILDAKGINGGYVESDGGSQRINIAGKFQALSQRIPVVSCVFLNSSKPEAVVPMLTKSVKRFDKILNALRDGNPKIKVFGAEKSRRILEYLEKLEVLWTPFRAATKNIIAGENVEESITFIRENYKVLQEAAVIVASEISAKYSNPVEVTSSEALLIDFSSRQRKRSQELILQICGVERGQELLGTMDGLKKSISTYDTTYLALRDGMPSVGIAPAPTEEIKAGLDAAIADWQIIKQDISNVSGVDSIGGDEVLKLFKQLDDQRIKLAKISLLYSKYAMESQ